MPDLARLGAGLAGEPERLVVSRFSLRDVSPRRAAKRAETGDPCGILAL